MLDTLIYDKLLIDNELVEALIRLQQAGIVRLVVTHIQRDQLLAIPDLKAEKRERLMRLFASLPQEQIPTDGGIWGISRWGEFRWGGPSQAEAGLFHGDNARDGLIGMTAYRSADVLVTDDRRFKNRYKRIDRSSVWSYDEFRAFVLRDRGETKNQFT